MDHVRLYKYHCGGRLYFRQRVATSLDGVSWHTVWSAPRRLERPLSGGNDGAATDLQACVGECDSDGQCAAGLKCFQRENGETIPGCSGDGGGPTWDYCYDPDPNRVWNETPDGHAVHIGAATRYIRHYSSGSNLDTGVHFLEIEVYASPAVGTASGESQSALGAATNLMPIRQLSLKMTSPLKSHIHLEPGGSSVSGREMLLDTSLQQESVGALIPPFVSYKLALELDFSVEYALPPFRRPLPPLLPISSPPPLLPISSPPLPPPSPAQVHV